MRTRCSTKCRFDRHRIAVPMSSKASGQKWPTEWMVARKAVSRSVLQGEVPIARSRFVAPCSPRGSSRWRLAAAAYWPAIGIEYDCRRPVIPCLAEHRSMACQHPEAAPTRHDVLIPRIFDAAIGHFDITAPAARELPVRHRVSSPNSFLMPLQDLPDPTPRLEMHPMLS